MQVTIEFEDCKGCPYYDHHYGQGECWYECNHPKGPNGYGNIIHGCNGVYEGVPLWCPVKKGEKENEQSEVSGCE